MYLSLNAEFDKDNSLARDEHTYFFATNCHYANIVLKLPQATRAQFIENRTTKLASCSVNASDKYHMKSVIVYTECGKEVSLPHPVVYKSDKFSIEKRDRWDPC
jgi:hypothetical protein